MPLAVSQSFAAGDKVVYIGPDGPNLPDRGQVGEIHTLVPNPSTGRLDVEVLFANGSVTLPSNVWDLYVAPVPMSWTSILSWWGVGVLAAVIGGAYLYSKKSKTPVE